MREALAIFIPLFGFMLIPAWIPLVALVFGKLADLARPREEQAMAARLAERRAAERAVAVPVATAAVATVTRLAAAPRHRADLVTDEAAA